MFKFQQDNYKLEQQNKLTILSLEKLEYQVHLLEQKVITLLEYLEKRGEKLY